MARATSSSPTRSGRRSRSRSAWRSSCARAAPAAIVGALPEPRRRDRVRARPRRVGRGSSPRTRCSSASTPDAEALIVDRTCDPPALRDRPDRRVLPARRADQGSAGRASPAGARSRQARRRVLRRTCGPGGGGMSVALTPRSPAIAAAPGRGLRRRPAARGRAACPPSRYAAAPTLRFDLHADRAGGTARSTSACCRRRSRSTRRKRSYDDGDARAAGRAVRRARALGARRRTSFQWARVDALVPGFTGASRVRPRGPVHATTSRSPRASTSTRCPDGDRAAVVPLQRAWCSTAATDDRLQVAQVPWSCTRPLATCRSRPGSGRSPTYYPGGGWVRLHDGDARRARRAQGRARRTTASTTACARCSEERRA